MKNEGKMKGIRGKTKDVYFVDKIAIGTDKSRKEIISDSLRIGISTDKKKSGDNLGKERPQSNLNDRTSL
jgi:hypothetical protein